ncbi:MAG: T9SS type A sorting domain-containing protein [Chitinophagales bacterium]
MNIKIGAALLIQMHCIVLVSQSQPSNWKAMPDGKDFSDLRCIYQDPNSGILYVGGKSRIIGNDTVNFIAQLFGNQWENVGNGANSEGGSFLSTILNYKQKLYSAGSIYKTEGNPGTGVMKWDGFEWNQVGNDSCEGTFTSNPLNSGVVLTLKEYDNLLYVGGLYDTIGCLSSHGIATWDGNHWDKIGNFYSDSSSGVLRVNCIFQYQQKIYAGGSSLYCYDGSTWKEVGNGIHGPLAEIHQMLVYNNELYVAGRFKKSDGNIGDNIQRWDGYQWHEVESGVNAQVWDMMIWHAKIYVFGGFTNAGDIPAKYIATWDGVKWCSLGSNLNSSPIVAGIYNDTLLIGGGFNVIDQDSIYYFAKWIGGDYVDTCSVVLDVNAPGRNNFVFSIFPNPITDILHLNFTYSASIKTYVEIHNLVGEKLINHRLTASDQSIDVSILTEGVYFFVLKSPDVTAVRKFIKQ